MKIDISKAAIRRKLAPRKEPHWYSLGDGRALGFRLAENARAGHWIARFHKNGERAYRPLGDDNALSFDDAKRLAEEWFVQVGHGAEGKRTVGQALDAYEASRVRKADDMQDERAKANAKQDAARVREHLGALAAVQIIDLTTQRLEDWLHSLTGRRKGKGLGKQLGAASRRRIFATLHAALDVQAKKHGYNSRAWHSAERVSVPKAEKAREFIPSRDELAKLIAECDEDFAPLVRVAAATGARYGELVNLRVRDFRADESRLEITVSKTGARVMRLSAEAVSIFKAACKDKLPGAFIFQKADGEPWGKSEQHRRMRRAARVAELPRSCVFYSLRHYAASTMLAAGIPSALAAKNLGTSEPMLRQHYHKFLRGDGVNPFEKIRALA